MDLSPWTTKTIRFDWRGRIFTFAVSRELFSSNAVDQGSLLLLRSLPWAALAATRHIVDFGCGYGPLGIVAAAMLPGARLTCIDRDALAVMFTRENLRLNLPDRPGQYDGIAGLDLRSMRDAGPDRCDLLLWNVPGKAGEPVLRGLCRQMPTAMVPGGLAALVVVNPLAPAIQDTVQALPGLAITLVERHTAHTVVHLQRDDTRAVPDADDVGDAFTAGVFDREERTVVWRDLHYALRPVHGLPEYDNPDYSSAIAMELLATVGAVGHGTIYQPGQGHVALAGLLLNGTRRWTLTGRDLLSLRATARNLALNGVAPEGITIANTPAIVTAPDSPPATLSIVMLDDQLSPQRVRQTVDSLNIATAPGGQVLLAGRSTSVSRATTTATQPGPFRVEKRLKRHGASAALLRRF